MLRPDLNRRLGSTGFPASRLGLGDVADRALPLEVCADLLRRGLDAGLNVVDTAPAYEDGFSEEIVARALHGRREGVFLIDKIDHLDRPVTGQLEESLRRLEQPAVDLLVFHGVSRLEDWDRITVPGGAFDELEAQVQAGRARFRGISSHHPDVLAAALASGRCDVVMFPIGPFADPRYEAEILPRARALGVGTIGFKTFGAGMLLGDTAGYGQPLADPGSPPRPRMSVASCLRYTLTVNPDVALLGLSSPSEQDAAFAATAAFAPLAPAELAAVRQEAARAIAGKGRVWWNPA
ncbi:MAG TPA: aldo/keto reductase [Holophagaceae bacterium]|nr:aldo/keto reductase [Holophagaceae bacterium]